MVRGFASLCRTMRKMRKMRELCSASRACEREIRTQIPSARRDTCFEFDAAADASLCCDVRSGHGYERQRQLRRMLPRTTGATESPAMIARGMSFCWESEATPAPAGGHWDQLSRVPRFGSPFFARKRKGELVFCSPKSCEEKFARVETRSMDSEVVHESRIMIWRPRRRERASTRRESERRGAARLSSAPRNSTRELEREGSVTKVGGVC